MPAASSASPLRLAGRAQRIEPFYVMEVAKAAAELAQRVRDTDRPMIFLNIGEPDFTAPPLVQAAAQRAPGRASRRSGPGGCGALRQPSRCRPLS
jgi:aspartate/methionine/tyrosine aminotransferase